MPDFVCRKNIQPKRGWVPGHGHVATDIPLFGYWTLSGSVPAGCGHDSCGEDWVEYHFATWEDALAFIAEKC